MQWIQIDIYWWKGINKDIHIGWIRLSAQNVGSVEHPRWLPKYVGWKNGEPIQFWFQSLSDCQRHMEELLRNE